MKIGPLSNSIVFGLPKGNQATEQAELSKSNPKKDQADISKEARAKVAELADQVLLSKNVKSNPSNTDNLNKKDGLNKEKLDIIREKIKTGFYDHPKIKNEIVNKLIDDLNLDTGE